MAVTLPLTPQPGSEPVTHGRLADFVDDPGDCMRRLHAQHGSLAAFQEGAQRLVFVFGPEWNQRVLSDGRLFHSRFFAVRGPKKSAHRRLTSGLLSMNGDAHKQHRRMVMGPFQKKTIGTYFDSIARFSHEMLEEWTPGEIRDVHLEMTRYMLRVTSGILFGVDVLDMAYRLGEKIDVWVHKNHETGMGAFISAPSYLDSYEELLALAEDLEAEIQKLIDLRRGSSGLGADVLSLLIKAAEEEGSISDAQLIGHVALMFGAAHLTTAHTLTWTLFLLAQHPSVMRGLHEEIQSVVTGLAPAIDDLQRMPITERVLKESMRILPASGYSQRMCAEATRLGPLQMPRGTPVIFSQFITHRLPGLYEQPDRFLPDRWLTATPSAYEYLPFGAGPRMCLGGPMAMMILKQTLPTILKRYRLTVVPDSEINGKIIATMLGPTSPVPMHVAPQDGKFAGQPVTGRIHDLVDLVEMPARRRAA